MMPHDDMPQDEAMIKQVLQKIIDDMEMHESGRIMPDSRKPKMVAAKIDVAEPMHEDEASEDLDPEILNKLMDKAGSADDSGALPEEQGEDLPPEILEAVRRKKGMQQ